MQPDIYYWEVRNNFPEADFWMVNKGSAETLGTITKEFEPHLTGIKCPPMIVPQFGYYLCEYIKQQGVWAAHAKGSINLKHLRITDIREVFKEISRSHRAQTKQRYKNFIPQKVKDREAVV